MGEALLALALLAGTFLGRSGGGLTDVDVIEHGGVSGQREPALPPRRHDDGRDLRERAPHQLLEPVPARAGEEDDEAGGDGGGAGAVSPAAAQFVVVLDV